MADDQTKREVFEKLLEVTLTLAGKSEAETEALRKGWLSLYDNANKDSDIGEWL